MAGLTDGRGIPLGEMRIWRAGQADPIVGWREAAWYDTRGSGLGCGSVTYADGLPTLEYLEMAESGFAQRRNERPGALVCRPRLILQDTRLTNYTTSGGSWEERRPATGAVRTYRLAQYDNEPGVIWSATSNFSLPADPNVAFSFVFVDSPGDWDDSALPPFIQITFANGGYAIYITKRDATLLAYDTSLAQFVPVAPLGNCRSADNSDNSECLLMLRCQRGQLGISTDGGDRYTWYGEGSAAVPFPASPFRVEGQGGMLVFGLHQLKLETGVYTSPERHARIPRPGATALQFETRDNETYGTISYTDLSAPASARAQYSIELTPTSTLLSGPGWSVYRSPEVYAVLSRYAAIPSPLGFTGSSFIQPDLRTATIEKPVELDGAGGTATFQLDPTTENYWNQGDWPKFELRLGHQVEGGGDYLETVLVGFITEVQVVSREYNEVTLQAKLTTVAERFKQSKWNKLDTFPLGGRTLNQALDLVLETEGVPRNISYRQWDFVGGLEWGLRGDRAVLPAGSPEDPFEWPRPGENKWATLQRLAGYVGLEVVPLDNGILTTIPKGYLPPVVSATYKATPEVTDQLQRLALSLEWRRNSREKATSVLVDGKDEDGNPLFAFAQDDAAEQNPLSPRFSPFRIEIQDSVDGTATPGLLAMRAGELAREYFREPIGVDLTHPVDLTLSRRLRVRIEGFEAAGIHPLYDFQLLTLTHRYDAEGKFGPSVTTVAGLETVV